MKTFSYSRLKMYESCPRRFYYRYIKGLKEETSYPLALGKAVHKAIECKINGLSREDALFHGLMECDFDNEVLTAGELSQLTDNAPENLEGETEMYFRLPLFDGQNDAELQGFIDLIDGDTIIDFKTNRKQYDVNDNHQMGLYAWAVQQIKDIDLISGTLYFLRFKKGSTYFYTEIDVLPAIEWARSLVLEIQTQVKANNHDPDNHRLQFAHWPSSECSHCPFVLNCFSECHSKYV